MRTSIDATGGGSFPLKERGLAEFDTGSANTDVGAITCEIEGRERDEDEALYSIRPGLDLKVSDLEASDDAVSKSAGQDANRFTQIRDAILADSAAQWSIGGLARQFAMSPTRLKLGFRQQFGSPIYAFVQEMRLERARALLAATTASVTEIATAVGYSNPSHFTAIFRRRFGMPPSAFRRNI